MNYANNVMETMTGTSAASFTPAGAKTNYRAFTAAYADGTTDIPVKVGPDSAGAWELGRYTLSGGVLTRNAVLDSSAGGTTAVTFATGTKDVIVVLPAQVAVDTENAVTLKSKRMQSRVVTTNAPGATPAINSDTTDRATFTGLAANISSMTTNMTGSPVAGDGLTIDLIDNGAARTIGWGAKYEDSSVSLPATTVAGKLLTVYFDWNPITSKWRCVGYS